MTCHEGGGWSVWLLFALSSAAVYLFFVRTEPLSRWLVLRRSRSVLWVIPQAFLRVGWLRVLGLLPLLMWLVSLMGLWCFIVVRLR